MKNIKKKLLNQQSQIAVVGLGYVGLPVAVAFAKKGIKVIGFDTHQGRIKDLTKGVNAPDASIEQELKRVRKNLSFTTNPKKLKNAGMIIVAVPTPIDSHKNPDLSYLHEASKLIGQNIAKGTIVVYESTVYPGATEEECLPILEKESGYSLDKKDFFIGYSPERINPGDKKHSFDTNVKVVAGQNEEVCQVIAQVYTIAVKAGVYRAESIKVAEAAKVIENTQRDLNIALMNELSIIFNRIGIDTESVLRAASTKWNFLDFYPGLVGGHCIGVDPFYLTSKADEVGYHPHVVLAGRRINDSMGTYVAQQTIKQMIAMGKVVQGSKILILGVSFKENVADCRNSRVFDVIEELRSYGAKIYLYDPLVKDKNLPLHSSVNRISFTQAKGLDAIIVATPHDEIKKIKLKEMKKRCKNSKGRPLLVDIRWSYSKDEAEKNGFHYWRL